MPQRPGLVWLSPPPRSVPARLRRQIWTGAGLCLASAAFGGILVFAVLFANPKEFAAATLLLFSSEEAPATVLASEETRSKINRTPVFAHRYSFVLPDGAVRQGRSFTTGSQRFPKQATVQYHPQHPWANVLQGTRPTRFGWLVLFVYLFPVIALLVVAAIVQQLRTTIHLLAHGAVGRATLISCVVQRDDTTQTIPFAQYRQQWLAARESADAPGVAGTTSPILGRGAHAFSCVAAIIIGLGVVLVTGMLVIVLLFDVPFRINDQVVGKGLATVALLGFLTLWCAMGYGFLWLARWAPNSVAEQVEVEFQFTPPSGETATCRQSVRFSELLGDEPTEPVLYDPDDPNSALLLDAIRPRVAVTPMGGWETAEERRTVLRALVIVAGLGGGPIASYLLAWWI